MKVSILIPTYNYDCVHLVKQLSQQLTPDCELIVADDGSSDQATIIANRSINNLNGCRLWEAPVNMGRSRIRNQLAKMAQGEWLIFLDSDADASLNPHFIAHYIEASRQAQVVCGGYIAPRTCPSQKNKLRFLYEQYAERNKTLERRQTKPYEQFSTFSFLIRRDVFLNIQFDESIKEYGHEDTLFGLQLKQQKVTISHIDNPLIHIGLDTNEEFLIKTEKAITNLISIEGEMNEHSRLLATANKLRRTHLQGLFRATFSLYRNVLRNFLINRGSSLLLFNIYKLGYYLNKSTR